MADDKPRGRVFCCRFCRTPMPGARMNRDFCDDKCRRLYHLKRETRGAKLYDLAMDWRRTRRKGGFTRLTRLLDEFLYEDRMAAKARAEAAAKPSPA